MTDSSKDNTPADCPIPRGESATLDTKARPPANRPPAGFDPHRDLPRPRESGGPKGPEPTRYGDWEKGGRCVDF